MLHLRLDKSAHYHVLHFAGKVPFETNKFWTIDDYKNIDNTMEWLCFVLLVLYYIEVNKTLSHVGGRLTWQWNIPIAHDGAKMSAQLPSNKRCKMRGSSSRKPWPCWPVGHVSSNQRETNLKDIPALEEWYIKRSHLGSSHCRDFLNLDQPSNINRCYAWSWNQVYSLQVAWTKTL